MYNGIHLLIACKIIKIGSDILLLKFLFILILVLITDLILCSIIIKGFNYYFKKQGYKFTKISNYFVICFFTFILGIILGNFLFYNLI